MKALPIHVLFLLRQIMCFRHPKEGAPYVASQHSSIPIINAGDGGHNHPTQTFTDLLTIKNLKGRFDNLTVGFCGDLKFGRTVHSLIGALSRYKNVKFVLISPDELKIPSYIKEETLDAQNIPYKEVRSLESAIPELDILYMTRVQKERFFNEEDYIRLKDTYILTSRKWLCKRRHKFTLPREMNATEVDEHPAKYLNRPNMEICQNGTNNP